MRFFKKIDNGYLIAIGEGDGETEITESEYRAVMQKIQNKPTASEGHQYRLRDDTLEWELVELPPVEETDLTADEALEIILGVSE